MKKLVFLVVLAVVGTCIAFGAPNVKPYLTFKVGTEHNKTSFFYTGLQRFKELVELGTNGGVQVQIYDSAALGSEGEMSEGVAMGTVEACLVGSSSIAKLIPGFNVFSLPYLFTNNAHVDAVFDSQIGQQFKDQLLEKKKVVMLDYWESGFRHYLNSKRPVNSPEDMKGLLIRIPNNPIQAATLKALGASSSTLAFNEVYMACANHVVDGQEGPVFAIVDSNMYEVQKYMVLDGHIYTVMGLLMSAKTFNKLTPADKAVVLKAAHDSATYEKQLIRDNEKEMVKFLQSKGMIVNENPDKKAWQDAMLPVYSQFSDTYGKELIDSIRNFKY